MTGEIVRGVLVSASSREIPKYLQGKTMETCVTRQIPVAAEEASSSSLSC